MKNYIKRIVWLLVMSFAYLVTSIAIIILSPIIALSEKTVKRALKEVFYIDEQLARLLPS